MDVLLIESHPGLGRGAADRLRSAGHRVFRCTDDPVAGGSSSGVPAPVDGSSGAAAGVEQPLMAPPCRGLHTDGSCPLDETALDAAVLVRVGPELRTGEHGAICAARNRIPLVVAGDATGAGLSPTEVTLLDDLPEAVERAASSGSAHASAVVRELLSLGVVARHELEGDAPSVVVQVARRPRRLVLTLWLREDDPREAELVRAGGQALRAYDAHVPVIDVVVRRLLSGEI